MKRVTILFFLSLFIGIIGRFIHLFSYRYFYIISFILFIYIIYLYFKNKKNYK